jgi:hypothetical protein
VTKLIKVTMAQTWEDFDRKVLPSDASAIQRSEMRKAFYAGAWSMLTIMKAAVDSDASELEQALYLEQLDGEIERFAKSFARPKL